MLRKRVITKPSQASSPIEGSIPIEDLAVVEVTSEQPHHPMTMRSIQAEASAPLGGSPTPPGHSS